MPVIDKEMFDFNLDHKTFDVLIQAKALKDCGCLTNEEDKVQCYAKFH